MRGTGENTALVSKFKSELEQSLNKVEDLEGNSPKVIFPEQLPISQRKDEIAKLINNNQVVIVAGETGSGKTTQIPKICLELGYGNRGLVGHTQPRRIAARTVADRIASELNSKLGDLVAYQIRFQDLSSERTKIKLMTDGVLLAEFQRDKFLSKYEVIIIDEAHERSLNIDFLLGLIKPLCAKRPELKVIITSATIDLEKFAEHFSVSGKAAPIIEVSGRTYPVEVSYQPIDDKDNSPAEIIRDTTAQIIENENRGKYNTSGDILIFCATEQEIRERSQLLRRAELPIEVLPLYSRLSIAEQNKVFKKATLRKVVLATNVAETSITVPGIAYVIDPGYARISRYSFRSKVRRLPIEEISQASAQQRMGRCGRVANGVCIRLYSEQNFDSRAEFTTAEILRSNLASVILSMSRLGIRNIENFDFIDKPDPRLVNDGYKLLQELNAIDASKRLTRIGRQMSDLPIEPRHARILVQANQAACLNDALVLVSALSIQDPRERPAENRQGADLAHKRLQHSNSDFFSYLLLWQDIQIQRQALSNTKFKQYCSDNFWSIARIFEWRELYRQLLRSSKDLGWKPERWEPLIISSEESKAKPSQKKSKTIIDQRYKSLHQSLLSGLMSNVAIKDQDSKYLAIRNRSLFIFPGSGQAKRAPKWILAAEFIETSRLFAHTVAEIKPEWIIDAAKHLCRYSYSSPNYSARSGIVKALRKTLFYGLTVRASESINYGKIKPQEARQIFIQQALIEGAYKARDKSRRRTSKGAESVSNFLEENQNLIRDIEKLETKTRRRNLLVNEESIYELYAERLPENICDRVGFEQWLACGNEDVLKLNQSQLTLAPINHSEIAQFPDEIEVLGKTVLIQYKFNPGKDQDGVTMLVPISVLALFPHHIGDWLVPGLLREKCIALIKTLPKPIRRNFAPAADAVDRVLPELVYVEQRLTAALANKLFSTMGIKLKAEDFQLAKLDNYYRMNYRVVDVDGSMVDESRDLQQLKNDYANVVRNSVHLNRNSEKLKLEKHNLRSWNFGELAESTEYQHEGMTIQAFPMLKVMDDNSISLLIHDQPATASYYSSQAIVVLAERELAQGKHKQTYKYLIKEINASSKPEAPSKDNAHSNSLKTQLKKQLSNKLPTSATIANSHWALSIINAAIRLSCFSENLDSIRNHDSFLKQIDTGCKNLLRTANDLKTGLEKALNHRNNVLKKVNSIRAENIQTDLALEDIKAQIYRLFDSNFLRYTSLIELQQYPRYLRAMEIRLEKLNASNSSLHTGQNQEGQLREMQGSFDRRVSELIGDSELGIDYVYAVQPAMRAFAIQLEEWRQLRAQGRVSAKRLKQAWQALENK